MSESFAQTGELPLSRPDSLACRAPRSVSLTDESGQFPTIGRYGYILSANQTYVVRIESPNGERVTIDPGDGIQNRSDLHSVEAPGRQFYEKKFSGKLKWPFLVPKIAKLRVNVYPTTGSVCTTTIQTVIHPSVRQRCVGIVGSAFSVVGLQSLWGLWTSTESIPALFRELSASPWIWGGFLATAGVSWWLLDWVGWAFLAVGGSDDD